MSDPKPCPFCDSYTMHRNISEFTKDHPEFYQNQTILYEIKTAIVVRSWPKGTPKTKAGRNVDFYYRGIGFPLRYCPTCGKELNL